jgi:hypothetical protein
MEDIFGNSLEHLLLVKALELKMKSVANICNSRNTKI